jgi:hypothetical protein
MGQRAFRGRITDSIYKNYFANDTKEAKDETQIYYKSIDLEYTFDLDNPLKDLNLENINLTRGLINLAIPRYTRIRKLKLTILSKHFGDGKSYLNCNLYILFGSHFIADIGEIQIFLINPVNNSLVNDRRVIQNILNYMCFKFLKSVLVNNNLLYFILPEYSEFSIVLAYNNKDYSEFSNNNLSYMGELFFHTYCMFEASIVNFSKCLRAIEKTVPHKIENIILPVICFSKNDVENFFIFTEFANFLNELSNRFKVISFEIKIKQTENYEELLSRFLDENYKILATFKHVFMSIELCNINQLSNTILKKLAVQYNLENITFAFHRSFAKLNSQTNLDDQYDYYDYIYYDKCFSLSIYKTIYFLKKLDYQLSKCKYIKHLILQRTFGENYTDLLFNEGTINFSQELVKNKKIVPLEISKDNALIYTN